MKYNAEIEKAGITDGCVAPAIIPDCTEEQVRERRLTADCVGKVCWPRNVIQKNHRRGFGSRRFWLVTA